ncbi:hypothetical protein HOH87_04460 [bacterium]|nr:hypothetical protein [bacterium]
MSFILGFVAAYAVGTRLPDRFVVSKSKAYDATPKQLWTILRDIEQYPKWRSGVKRIEVLGKNEKGFLTWKEYFSRRRNNKYEFSSLDYLKTMKIKVLKKKVPIAGTMVVQFSEHEGKGIIHLKHFVIISNPYHRFVAKYVKDKDYYVDVFLVSLNRRLKQIEKMRLDALTEAKKSAEDI